VFEYVAVCCSMLQCFYVFSRKCHKVLHSFKPWYWAFMNMHIYTVAVCGGNPISLPEVSVTLSWSGRGEWHDSFIRVTWCMRMCDMTDWLEDLYLAPWWPCCSRWHWVCWVTRLIHASMSQLWLSYGAHMNESWHTYEWVVAHKWMSHGSYMNGWCHIYDRVMTRISKNHDTHKKELCHTYECIMSRI